MVIALCSASRVQSLHCVVHAAVLSVLGWLRRWWGWYWLGVGVGLPVVLVWVLPRIVALLPVVAGFGGGVFVLVGGVFPYCLPCFHTCIRTWRDLVFAQVYAEDAADGHDAIEEGSVVGCGGGNGDTASLSWGS